MKKHGFGGEFSFCNWDNIRKIVLPLKKILFCTTARKRKRNATIYNFFLSFCLIRFNFFLEKIHILSRWYWFGHDYNFFLRARACTVVKLETWGGRAGSLMEVWAWGAFLFLSLIFFSKDRYREQEKKKFFSFKEREFYKNISCVCFVCFVFFNQCS